MPVAVTIDPEQRLTITIGEGVVTDEEFLRAREQLLANPAFDPTFDRIWDFHAITEARVSDAVAARLIVTSPDSEKPICRAVVVSERTTPMKAILDFINRVRQTNRGIAAFPDRGRAEKWIATCRADLPLAQPNLAHRGNRPPFQWLRRLPFHCVEEAFQPRSQSITPETTGSLIGAWHLGFAAKRLFSPGTSDVRS